MAYVYKVKQGDTLNSIAQQYGFSNYKQAGISSVPSGNFDLIRAGESITLGNYDPNKIQGVQTGSSVISSKDNAQSFNNNSNELDRLKNGLVTSNDKTKDTTVVDKTDKTKFDLNKDGQITDSSDPVLAKINAYQKEQQIKAQQDAEKQKKEYERLFRTQLSAIDAVADATTRRIFTTYDKRLEEQARINDLNIARVKAYGLGGGGRFTPVSFGDAITNREREASDKITQLESQRDSLIAQAEQARQEGESALLENKMEDIFNVEKALRDSLAKIEKDAEAQYKLLRDLRQEEEAKHQAEVKQMQERLAVLATSFGDEFDSMSSKDKDELINTLVEQTGLDYATVYSTIKSSQQKSLLDSLDIQKKKADITATNALTAQRNRANQNGGNTFSETEIKKLKQAGLDGADEQTKLDYLYGDDVEKENAKLKAGGGGSIQTRAESAGFDYQAMKAQGYDDEEIKQALDEAGY